MPQLKIQTFVINEHYKQVQSFYKLTYHNLIYLDKVPATFITTVYHKDCYDTDVLTCMHTRANTHIHARTQTPASSLV
jgi:hypothetical protein